MLKQEDNSYTFIINLTSVLAEDILDVGIKKFVPSLLLYLRGHS